jgi:hypothetical protein
VKRIGTLNINLGFRNQTEMRTFPVANGLVWAQSKKTNCEPASDVVRLKAVVE